MMNEWENVLVSFPTFLSQRSAGANVPIPDLRTCSAVSSAGEFPLIAGPVFVTLFDLTR